MTEFEDRDDQIATMIRGEIEKVKWAAKHNGWTPGMPAWQRAFGEIAGMYKILALVDPNGYAEGQAVIALAHTNGMRSDG